MWTLGAVILFLAAIWKWRQVRQRAATPRRVEPRADAPARPLICAAVWAAVRARDEQLRALGEKLRDWKAEHPDVTEIRGLDCFLDGRYPEPFGYFEVTESMSEGAIPSPYPCVTDRHVGERERVLAYIAEPWKFCPVVIYAMGGQSIDDDHVASLELAIPKPLISCLTNGWDVDAVDHNGWRPPR